jgi:hypothetical protein
MKGNDRTTRMKSKSGRGEIYMSYSMLVLEESQVLMFVMGPLQARTCGMRSSRGWEVIAGGGKNVNMGAHGTESCI